jgi:peptidoglycan/LPS O-acetylase OafA/YrhL
MSSNVRFNALTGFRAIAAILVFVYHNRKYWRDSIHPELLRFINEFHVGVSLFFVLSGFLIAYTYEHKPSSNLKSFSSYILLRMARILPLYWLILTAYYLDPEYGKYKFSLLTYSLAHGFSNVHNLDAIAQAWSLTVEMTFYFLAPFLFLLLRKNIVWLIFSLSLIFIVSWLTGEIWYKLNKNPEQYFYPLNFVSGATFSGRSFEFFIGMILAHTLKNRYLNTFWQFNKKTYIGFFGIFVITYIVGLFQVDKFHHGVDHIVGYLIHMYILPIFTAVFIAGLISEKNLLVNFLSSKPMVILGEASFAFYLIHISYVNLKIKQLWLGFDRNFILLWVVSILLYFLFEKPVYNFIKKSIKQKKII